MSGTWTDLGRWCRERATLDSLTIEVVAERVAMQWASTPRTPAKTHPLAFLIANPTEYWLALPKPTIDPHEWNRANGLLPPKKAAS